MSTKHLVVNHGKNPHLAQLLVDYGSRVGFKPHSGLRQPDSVAHISQEYDCLCFYDGYIGHDSHEYFEKDLRYEIISVEEFFRRTTKPPKPEFYEVKLNGEHTAKVYKDKVVVGCQTFSATVLNELIAAHEKAKAE